MLRVFGAFLSIFWLLGVVVHLDGLADLFGATALALFAIDLLLVHFASRAHASRARRASLL
jgi:hypothetical protein